MRIKIYYFLDGFLVGNREYGLYPLFHASCSKASVGIAEDKAGV
ncbi:MAG: hypothetical protein VKL59_21765 [Nostocaceae cyanobacterium]|nr:hypothetical protein [Nostocaceae cyanobacterium]